MSNRPEQQLLDDRLRALGRLERRRLLLRLSTPNSRAEPHVESRVDFDELDPNVGQLGRAGELGRGGKLDRDGKLDPFVAMRHLHLPVLEDGEFVHWDRENHRVTKGARFDELEPLLGLLRDLQDDLPGRWV